MASHQVCSSENEANFESLENLLKLTVAKFCENSKFINSRIAAAQLDGERGGEISTTLFQKLEKRVPILEKNALVMGIYGLHFSCGFKTFQGKKSKSSCGVDRMFIDVP